MARTHGSYRNPPGNGAVASAVVGTLVAMSERKRRPPKRSCINCRVVRYAWSDGLCKACLQELLETPKPESFRVFRERLQREHPLT